jgi:hypothetical protein
VALSDWLHGCRNQCYLARGSSQASHPYGRNKIGERVAGSMQQSALSGSQPRKPAGFEHGYPPAGGGLVLPILPRAHNSEGVDHLPRSLASALRPDRFLSWSDVGAEQEFKKR